MTAWKLSGFLARATFCRGFGRRALAMALFAITTQLAPAATPDDPNNIGAAIVVPFEAAIGTWQALYVNPVSGNDSNAGTVGAPLQTLAAAMGRTASQAPPAATQIHLAAGSYGGLGSYAGIARTAATPIKISGATDAAGEPLTIVDGGADGLVAAGAMCLRFTTMTYLVVENIRCQNAFPHGANIDDGGDYSQRTHHLVLRNWRIRNVGVYANVGAAGNSDCLKLSGVDDFWVLSSELENCVNGEFIDMVGAHRGLIARNYFHDKPVNGVQVKGGSSDILITRNTFERVEQRFIQLGGGAGAEDYRPSDALYPASRIDVIANIIRDVGIYGGRSDHRASVFSVNGCHDCLVAHNTILEMQFNALLAYIDKEEPNRLGNDGVTVANNIYVMNDGANRPRTSGAEFLVTSRGESTAVGVQFRNEVYFDADDPGANPIDIPSSLQPTQFQGTAVFDPQVEANARLGAGSMAIGFGVTGFAARVPGDYLGSSYGSPPSAGAFAAPLGSSVRPNPPVLTGVQ